MQNSKKTGSYREKYLFPLSENSISKSKPRRGWINILFTKVGWACCVTLLLTVSSCSPTKKNVYFENLQKDTTLRNVVTANYELIIQKNDLLSITVASLSPDVALYNASQNSTGVLPGPLNGYAVDENGNINFVKLGVLHVAGMTRTKLKDTLEKALVPYLREAVVSVGFLNRHVTMMGAVNPQVLQIVGDNMTLLDALAASGDIGEKGKIDNILVIRDTNGAKEFKRLSLKDHSIFYSPYYYLQPNDIVYVEPTNIKTKLTAPQLISYITAGASLIFLILNALKL